MVMIFSFSQNRDSLNNVACPNNKFCINGKSGRYIFQLFFLLLFFSLPSSVYAQCTTSANTISGIAFRDYNSNGLKDTYEPGASGVLVVAYNSSNVEIASTSTATDGTYSLTVSDGSSVRLEFQSIASYLYAGTISATTSKARVSFLNSPACDYNLALSKPNEYCQSNPNVATSCYVNGDPLDTSGTTKNADFFVMWSSSNNGIWSTVTPTAPMPNHLAFAGEIGATWGVAVQRETKSIFTAAVLRRHTGLGPLGTGGIYKIDYTNPLSPVVSNFVDLNTLTADTNTLVNTGANPRLGPSNEINFGLSGNPLTTTNDANTFDTATYVAFGDLDISEDERYLYAMSLGDKTLYKVFIDNPAQTPGAGDVVAFPIPNPAFPISQTPGDLGCSNNDYRPWAIKIKDGKTYVSVTCTARTSQNAGDLKGYILELNETTKTFSSVFQFNFAYTRGDPHTLQNLPFGDTLNWKPEPRNFADIGVTGLLAYASPNISAIDQDESGNWIISVMDSNAMRFGYYQLPPYSPPNGLIAAMPTGEILKACKNGLGGWDLESNGSCGGVVGALPGNNQGPGGGEFIEDRDVPATGIHHDSVMGANVAMLGTGEIVFTGNRFFARNWAGGVRVSDVNTGQPKRHYEVYPGEAPFMAKSVGLGDLELLCDPAPIEIGDRVWMDTNANGVQDVGEMPISGVTVNLYLSGVLVGTTLTDSNGNYVFGGSSDANMIAGSILPRTTYQIKLNKTEDFAQGGPLYKKGTTSKDVGFGTFSDGNDSDATAELNGFSTITFTTGGSGENNHTLDFGYYEIISPDFPGVANGPVYFFWNTFLKITNIASMHNGGGSLYDSVITTFSRVGNFVVQYGTWLYPNGNSDVILKGLPANSYGIGRMDVVPDNWASTYDGLIAQYRFASNGREVEFAKFSPLIQSSTGTKYIIYNTYQPSMRSAQINNQVTNWVEVGNPDTVLEKSFTVNIYNTSGSLVSSRSFSVPRLGRFDVQGGHSIPGAFNQGLIEVIPTDSTAPFITQVSRYGADAPVNRIPSTYSFATSSVGNNGYTTEIMAPVSSGGGAQNWVVVTNTASVGTTVLVEMLDYYQNTVMSNTFSISAKAQLTINAHALFPGGSSGVVKVTPLGSEAIIADSMFYFYKPDGSVSSAYVSHAEPNYSSPKYGTYNSYLGQQNWLKLFNNSNAPVNVTINVRKFGIMMPATDIGSATITLQAKSGMDAELATTLGFAILADTYGTVEISTSSPGVFAQMLRVKRYNGYFDIAASIPIR